MVQILVFASSFRCIFLFSSELQGSCLWLPLAGITSMPHHAWLFMWVQGWELDPHAGVASTFRPSQPDPGAPVSELKDLFFEPWMIQKLLDTDMFTDLSLQMSLTCLGQKHRADSVWRQFLYDVNGKWNVYMIIYHCIFVWNSQKEFH